MGWEVTPSEGVQIVSPGSKNTDIVFPENNTAQDITYTIKYVDGSGKCGTTNLTVKKCDSPGPIPPTESYPFTIVLQNDLTQPVTIGGGSDKGIVLYVCGKSTATTETGGCHVSIRGTLSSDTTLQPGETLSFEMDGKEELECLSCQSSCVPGCGGAPGTDTLYFQRKNENNGDTRAIKIYDNNGVTQRILADPFNCGQSENKKIEKGETYTVHIVKYNTGEITQDVCYGN